MRPAPLRWLTKLGERGNVALMTAIVMPVLLLVGGFAVDYGYASYLNQRLTQATDNAVLASVSQSAATAGGGFANTKWLKDYGTRVFNSNIADLPISDVKLDLQVTRNAQLGVNSVGTYSYSFPTFFAGVVGISTIPLSSQIKASANPVTYIDFYILVDVSQSMGIAATQAEMNALWSRIISYNNQSGGEPSCVFGCHVATGSQKQTNEDLAHLSQFGPYINLRIDAAVAAIQSVINSARTQAGTNKNIRVGLYTINRDPNKPGVFLTVVSAPSADYTTLSQQAATINLGGNNSSGSGDSDFKNELNAFNAILPPNGSGASAVAPKNYVFLITDGLSDASIGCGNCHPTAPFDPSSCNQLKLKSTVGTIYTTYNAIFEGNDQKQGLEGNYKNLVSNFVKFKDTSHADPALNDYTIVQDAMADGLAACSSDSTRFYFQAKDGPGITSAMNSLFASTLQNARLTQ